MTTITITPHDHHLMNKWLLLSTPPLSPWSPWWWWLLPGQETAKAAGRRGAGQNTWIEISCKFSFYLSNLSTTFAFVLVFLLFVQFVNNFCICVSFPFICPICQQLLHLCWSEVLTQNIWIEISFLYLYIFCLSLLLLSLFLPTYCICVCTGQNFSIW